MGSALLYTHEGVNNPLFDLIGELLEIHVLFIRSNLAIAIHIDVITRQLAGELDVIAALADGEADLIVIHIDIGEHVLVVEDDAGDLSRAEGSGDEQGRVGGPVDDIDVFVAELTDDAMDT